MKEFIKLPLYFILGFWTIIVVLTLLQFLFTGVLWFVM